MREAREPARRRPADPAPRRSSSYPLEHVAHDREHRVFDETAAPRRATRSTHASSASSPWTWILKVRCTSLECAEACADSASHTSSMSSSRSSGQSARASIIETTRHSTGPASGPSPSAHARMLRPVVGRLGAVDSFSDSGHSTGGARSPARSVACLRDFGAAARAGCSPPSENVIRTSVCSCSSWPSCTPRPARRSAAGRGRARAVRPRPDARAPIAHEHRQRARPCWR